MKDVFVADAHLSDPGSENFRHFLDFLEGLRGRTRTLFLLGDIFEFWIGYRHVVFAPYVPILDALRRLKENGTEIVYVEGNHDFHVGPWFEKVLEARILPDGGEIEVDNLRLLIIHGDLIDTSDSGYRSLRRLLRSRPFKILKSLIPPDLAWSIARWGSLQSQKKHSSYNNRQSAREMVSAFGEKKLTEGFDGVISGHFHTPFIQKNRKGTIISLGDWIDQYSYAVLENGVFSLDTW